MLKNTQKMKKEPKPDIFNKLSSPKKIVKTT